MPEHAPDRWQQIERLYHRALEQPSAKRAAFLDEACGSDDALKKEVQSLLAFATAADTFLEQPALAHAARALTAESRPRLTGRRLGGYEVSAPLGVGGMGEVYRARDVRLGREVALKVLEPSIAADPIYLRRFEEEARSASILNHPNIVTIFGVGEDGDIAFIAMELVQGQTLRERIGSGALPIQDVLDLGVQLASALAAAHENGIVHRDLKPENVMVTPEGVVKVLDFGIAKRQGAAPAPIGADDHTLTREGTQAGTILGTVGYMSPEQAAGKPAGFTSDQFSLGAMLYEMLAGRRAFQRDSRIETLAAIIHAEPEPVQHLNPQVPAPMRAVIDRCLAKDPTARYPTTRDLEDALRQIRDRARSWTRRQLLWWGGATAAAGVAGLLTWRFWPPRSLAVLPFANTAGDDELDYLCTGIAQSLIERMWHLPIAVTPFSAVSNFVDTSADARTIGRQLRVDTVLSGAVRLQAGRLMILAELSDISTGASLWKNSYDHASSDIFAIWDEIATAIVDDGLHLRVNRAERLQLLNRPTKDIDAYDLFLRARHLQGSHSEAEYLEARRMLEEAVAKDPGFAGGWIELAGTYWTAAIDGYMRPADAWPHVDVGLARVQELNPRLPELHVGLATKQLFSAWNWAEAEREWQTATGAADRIPSIMLWYALQRYAMGHPEESLALIKRARVVDPISPNYLNAQASYLFRTGDLRAAADIYLDIMSTHEDASDGYFGLAEVRRAQGRFDEAIATRAKGHELEGDDLADEEFSALLSTAKGEAGYHQIDQMALRRLEIPRLERRVTRGGYASPLDFARAYAQLDDHADKETAFGYLSAACAERAPGLVFLNVDSAWSTIRGDRRFREAVTFVGLPGSVSA